jgi:hypothetical protein
MDKIKTSLRVGCVLALLALLQLCVSSLNVTYYVQNVSVSPKVWLNDYVSGSVFLIDSNNMTLEGIPCSVVAIDNDTKQLLKVWDVSCRKGEPYLDGNGNWVVISKTCKISDSMGYYYFKGGVMEDEGFQMGRYYDLKFTCGGASNSSTFYVDVPKPQDVSKWFAFSRRYLGIIVFLLFVAILIMVIIYLVRRGHLTL